MDDASAIALEDVDLKELVRYISFDFERFALASRESLVVACSEKTLHNLAGWPLLKLYYSAFFAAHAIMRSQGTGVVKIERAHAQHVNQLLTIFEPDHTSIAPGMYLYSILPSMETGSLSVVLTPLKDRGGVHQTFWRLFCDLLQDAASAVAQRDGPNAADFIAGAAEVSDAIKLGGYRSVVWFSAVRNEINYQHRHSTWFPLKKDGKVLSALDGVGPASSNTVRFDISKAKDPIAAFANTSRYLALLNIEVADYIAKRSTAGGSFGQKWRRFVHQLC